jgi:DNA-binding NarL/FixJ family response regulator
MATHARVQVAVVDPCALGRDVLTGSLSSHRGIDVCVACVPERQTLQVCQACQPHVAVFWLRPSEAQTSRFLMRFGRHLPAVGRIAIMDDAGAHRRVPHGALTGTGAQRVCYMDEPLGKLVACIQELAAPASVSSGALTFEPPPQTDPPPARLAFDPGAAPLSLREQQILLAIGEGLGNKAIADRFSVAVTTVYSYRERLRRKLALSGSELLQTAIRSRA